MENFGAVTEELEGLRTRLEAMKDNPQCSGSYIRQIIYRMDELLY